MKEFNTPNQQIHYLKEAIAIKKQKWPEGTVPLVSISCTAYNQKDYITECLESFLAQETTFPVEIIIHDDASTDGTTEIIKEYCSLYPHLFQATLQKENQFSLGVNYNNFNFLKAKGKYIALCHGDDYWIDNRKLAKQIIAMEGYNVDISGHPAELINIESKFLGKKAGFKVSKTTHFTSKKLINNNGNMLPFGSIIITAAAKDNMIKYMPPVIFHSGFQLLGALKNGLLVLPDAMSTYRVEVPGSTTSMMLGDINKKVETTIKRIHSIKTLKKLYGASYYLVLNKFLARQIKVVFHEEGKKYKKIILEEIMGNEKLVTRSLLHSLILKHEFRYKLSKLGKH